MTKAAKDQGTAGVGVPTDYVTFVIADQLFGVPVAQVQDVFSPQAITRVPLAKGEIGGVLNLRGRIVTAIDLRRRLGLPPRTGGKPPMAVGIERGGEYYGLLIDRVGEVLSPDPSSFERNPENLAKEWVAVSRGIYRLKDSLLIVLDVDLVLEFGSATVAA
jgi:purine-binding chemotaxis protein CheW